ncbi:MAG: hypothetical protein PHG82_04400 [Candidatus Gracilibacteria bacterium]|nr:hypothetical protein [Candidatus Gracilibacteria bacterium]
MTITKISELNDLIKQYPKYLTIKATEILFDKNKIKIDEIERDILLQNSFIELKDNSTWLIKDISGTGTRYISSKNIKIWELLEDISQTETLDYTLRPIIINGIILNKDKINKIFGNFFRLEHYLMNLNDSLNIIKRLKLKPDQENTDDLHHFNFFLFQATRSYLFTSIWHYVDKDKKAHSLTNILLDIIELGCFEKDKIIDDICKLNKINEEIKNDRDKSISHRDQKQAKKEINKNGYSTTLYLEYPKEYKEKIKVINDIVHNWKLALNINQMENYTNTSKGNLYYNLSY